MRKIIDKNIFRTEIRPKLKEQGKTIALCHGVFDLIHPGHIIHLQQAKSMADILVVSITAAKYVRKGPGRPYFDDEMRMCFLEAIECVDYVMLSEGYTVDDIVECVEPDIYVKGAEYAKESEDLTGNMTPERELVEEHGGRVEYTAGQVFSSTKLINTAMSGLQDDVIEYMRDFKTRYSMEDIKKYATKAEGLKVLVLGDIIIDKYTYCNIQGLMSKDMGYSARLQYTEQYLGGAAAIARHLSSFSDNVTLMSIMGNEEVQKCRVFDELIGHMQLKLIYSKKIPTIVKQRYLTRNGKREEYRKIFAIHNIQEYMEYEPEVRKAFHEALIEKINQYDVVFVCDFGHGLINEQTMAIIQNNAKFVVLNCQTNSANYGKNIITKYKNADRFTLDQRELTMAFPTCADECTALKSLNEHLNGKGWLTRGSKGACGIENGQIYECPAFTLNVKDTVGAGDAFYAAAGIFAAAGAPVELSMFAGNTAGALGANIIGNKEAVEKVNVLKYASTLMNV